MTVNSYLSSVIRDYAKVIVSLNSMLPSDVLEEATVERFRFADEIHKLTDSLHSSFADFAILLYRTLPTENGDEIEPFLRSLMRSP